MSAFNTIQETSTVHFSPSNLPGNPSSLFQTATSSETERRFLTHELVVEALALLREKLSEECYYHSLEHTKSVVVNAVRCAALDGVSTRDLELIAIAAAWHDTGFIVQRHANEPIGADMALSAMRRHGGYEERELADVATAILDTQVHFDPELGCMAQTAHGRLSPWLLDGDLSSFGHSGFLDVSLLLLREFTGVEVTEAEDLRNPKAVDFFAGTVRMLGAHRYISTGGKLLFDEQKRVNQEIASCVLANAINGTPESLQRAWKAAHCVV